jgi:16S rRNA C967 or C1407 C5-methylase (RsmB/RsmF family)
MYWAEQLISCIKKGSHLIDARAGCGTKITQLSELVGETGKIFAFESRPSRLESLKLHLSQYGCKSIKKLTLM